MKRLFAFVAAICLVASPVNGYNVPGFPVYVSNSVICVKKDDFLRPLREWRCVISHAEYASAGRCNFVEWMSIAVVAGDARRRGYLVAADVECIAELDA